MRPDSRISQRQTLGSFAFSSAPKWAPFSAQTQYQAMNNGDVVLQPGTVFGSGYRAKL
jgi:hypothetical protein